MALLRMLQSLAPTHRWKLTVAHFNHQLRGRASDADEQFVIRQAAKSGLETVVGRGDIKSFANQHGVSIEMAARALRHGFLATTARQLNIRSIALAHHTDDQVELFFLRLLRGAGGEGLAGMKWRSPSPADSRINLIRPMLDLNKDDIQEFARGEKVGFRRDASNESSDILRNRIRHELLPLLRSRYQPAIHKVVPRLMDIAGRESELASATASQWLKTRRIPFGELPVAAQRHVIRIQMIKLGINAGFDRVETMRETAGKQVATATGARISRNSSGIIEVHASRSASFDAARFELPVRGRSGHATLDNVRCDWRIIPHKTHAFPGPVAGRECFDAEKIGARITLRHWRAGDRFQPIGMKSHVKLQDWFTNLKIPRAVRHQLLVAESESGGIFWVEGQRIGELFKLTPSTRLRLVWNWKRGGPQPAGIRGKSRANR